jgi:5-methylcytosine-specific restriction protein A
MSGFYSTRRWRYTAQQILIRDNFTCSHCGASRYQGARIDVDHIQPIRLRPDLAYDPDNLRLLCRRCHNKRTHGRRTSSRAQQLRLRMLRADL